MLSMTVPLSISPTCAATRPTPRFWQRRKRGLRERMGDERAGTHMRPWDCRWGVGERALSDPRSRGKPVPWCVFCRPRGPRPYGRAPRSAQPRRPCPPARDARTMLVSQHRACCARQAPCATGREPTRQCMWAQSWTALARHSS